MNVLVVSLLALAASSLAAPHGFILKRQDSNGAPFMWLSALNNAHAQGSGLAPPVGIPRPTVVVGPHHGFTLSTNTPMSQWLHSVVRNAVSHHNALHKSLSFVPAVNRYHGSYVVPAANQYHGSYVVPAANQYHGSYVVPAANQYHGSYVVPAHGLPQSPLVPTTSTTTTTTAAPSTTTLRPRSLEGDTAVNYVGPVPRDNPNAEVFDEELVREDARRHFDAVSEEFGEAQPLSPELIRSQPVEPTSAPVL